jgi:anti-sigma factor ChrR (cupin superfamily)
MTGFEAAQSVFLHQDRAARVVVPPDSWCWRSSPVALVERMMLERNGGERARATSVVRYQPGACFLEHDHAGGEEFLVLDGELRDAHGLYPRRTYVRNPPGLRHAPVAGPEGATIFVKVRHFASDDLERVVLDTAAASFRPGLVGGLSVLPLHEHGGVSTALVRWAPETRFHRHRHFGGEEIFVLEGVFRDEHGDYPAGSWLRSPHLSQHTPFTGAEGALILVKVGHLAGGVE